MRRVVIELEEEVFKTLNSFKNFCGLQWRDLLMGGFAYWYKEMNMDELKRKLEEMLQSLETKQN